MEKKSEGKSDGCTFAPDLDFRICCVSHDRYYSKGSKIDRKEADLRLRNCIWAKARNKGFFSHKWHRMIGTLYYMGVRNFGKSRYKGSGDST